MIRRSLLLAATAGILAATTFGTAQNAEAGPACAAGGAFPAGAIVDLANTPYFDPAQYAACGLQPGGNCAALRPMPGGQSTYATLIADAINKAASPALHNNLCTLDHIYIDTTPATTTGDTNSAWGMREVETPKGGSPTILGLHIGLRANLIALLAQTVPAAPNPPEPGGAQFGPFSSYETQVVRTLLNQPSTGKPLPPEALAWINSLLYSAATPDPGAPNNPPTTALLGILGHEMGHILWVSKVQGYGATVPTPCPIPGMPHPNFWQYSWHGPGTGFGYHKFGEIDTNNRPVHPSHIQTIITDLENNNLAQADADLVALYQSGHWASLFATVAVDEDFVETYLLHELNEAQVGSRLTDLYFTIPPPTGAGTTVTQDVTPALGNPSSSLAEKAAWIQQCIEGGVP